MQQTAVDRISPNGSTTPGGMFGAGSGSVFNATLKGKINGLEETVRVLADEITFYSSEIVSLKQEKNELEENLAIKTKDIRAGMIEEVKQSDANMKQQCVSLKKENVNA